MLKNKVDSINLFRIKKTWNYLTINQFYKYLFFLFQKLIITKLIFSVMYISSLEKLINKDLMNLFLGVRLNKVVYNLLINIIILKQFFIFSFKLLKFGGAFLICSRDILPEVLIDALYELPQSCIMGMPYGGFLTNKKLLIAKLKTSYIYAAERIELKDVLYVLKKNILYSERMFYNKHLHLLYVKKYWVPNCLIILNLNSFILLEALRLNIPILGIGTNIDKLQSITYPLLLNQNSIYSIFLFLNFLNVMFNITGYWTFFEYKTKLFKFLESFNKKNFFHTYRKNLKLWFYNQYKDLYFFKKSWNYVFLKKNLKDKVFNIYYRKKKFFRKNWNNKYLGKTFKKIYNRLNLIFKFMFKMFVVNILKYSLNTNFENYYLNSNLNQLISTKLNWSKNLKEYQKIFQQFNNSKKNKKKFKGINYKKLRIAYLYKMLNRKKLRKLKKFKDNISHVLKYNSNFLDFNKKNIILKSVRLYSLKNIKNKKKKIKIKLKKIKLLNNSSNFKKHLFQNLYFYKIVNTKNIKLVTLFNHSIKWKNILKLYVQRFKNLKNKFKNTIYVKNLKYLKIQSNRFNFHNTFLNLFFYVFWKKIKKINFLKKRIKKISKKKLFKLHLYFKNIKYKINNVIKLQKQSAIED